MGGRAACCRLPRRPCGDPSGGVLPPAQALLLRLGVCKRGSSARQEKPPPRAPAPGRGAGTKARTFCHMQPLRVSCTCPPPANNMYFIYGQTVLKRRSVLGCILLRKPDQKGCGQGLWHKAGRQPACDLPLGNRLLWKDVAGGGTLWDHWNILGCRPPGCPAPSSSAMGAAFPMGQLGWRHPRKPSSMAPLCTSSRDPRSVLEIPVEIGQCPGPCQAVAYGPVPGRVLSPPPRSSVYLSSSGMCVPE